MAIYEFTAQALTPIFVGCGIEIDPTQFYLEENTQPKKLVQFDPNKVILGLSPKESQRFAEISKRNNLNELRAFLETNAKRLGIKMNEVIVSDEFANEFKNKASDPDNAFRVEMMPRNQFTGKVYIPGSSIKGAIRTAVINYFANYDHTTHQKLKQELSAEKNINAKYKILEEKTLNRASSETEKDLFRFIKVEDAELPAGATQIDRARNFNPKNPSSMGIKIWVERLRSRVDGIQTVPKFKVKIHLNEDLMNHEEITRILGRKIDFDTLIKACNDFYWGRFQYEERKFYSKLNNPQVYHELHESFKATKDSYIKPDSSSWCDDKKGKYRIFLRIGRYSHFESLSVDNFREQFDSRRRTTIKEGSSRTVCSKQGINPGLPFGWLILTYERK